MTLRRAMSASIPAICFSICAVFPAHLSAQEKNAAQPRTYLLETVDDAAVVQVYADAFNDLSRLVIFTTTKDMLNRLISAT